jgi:hypothetical protein
LSMTPAGVPGPISRAFRKSGQRSGTRLLAPKGDVGAEIARDRMRDLPDKIKFVRTAEKFEHFVGNKLNSAETAINRALERTVSASGGPRAFMGVTDIKEGATQFGHQTLGQTSFNFNPIIKQLESVRKNATINEIAITDQRVSNLDAQINKLKKIQESGNVTLNDAIKIRREIDDSVDFAAVEESAVSLQAVRRDTANLIRDQINSLHPEIAQANELFSFWKDIEKFARLRGNRKITAEVLANITRFESIMTGSVVTGAAGLAGAVGGLPPGASSFGGLMAFGGSQILKETTGFQSFNAVAKSRIAALLSRGEFQAAADFLTTVSIINQSKDDQQKEAISRAIGVPTIVRPPSGPQIGPN